MKKKKTSTPRRNRTKERLEYAQSRMNAFETSRDMAEAKASDLTKVAETICALLVSERSDLLARVEQINALLIVLGVRMDSQTSPSISYWPSASDLLRRR